MLPKHTKLFDHRSGSKSGKRLIGAAKGQFGRSVHVVPFIGRNMELWIDAFRDKLFPFASKSISRFLKGFRRFLERALALFVKLMFELAIRLAVTVICKLWRCEIAVS